MRKRLAIFGTVLLVAVFLVVAFIWRLKWFDQRLVGTWSFTSLDHPEWEFFAKVEADGRAVVWNDAQSGGLAKMADWYRLSADGNVVTFTRDFEAKIPTPFVQQARTATKELWRSLHGQPTQRVVDRFKMRCVSSDTLELDLIPVSHDSKSSRLTWRKCADPSSSHSAENSR